MKRVVYYSNYMKEKQKKQKMNKLKKIFTYTLVAILSMQGAQMYSMASFAELLQDYTVIKKNSFIPKQYTNVNIEEPNGMNYLIETDGTVNTSGGMDKEAYFTNPIDNVTYEYVRAKVVAVVKYTDGNNADDTVVEYTITSAPDSVDGSWIQNGKYYYYSKAIKPGGQTSNFLSSVMINAPTQAELQMDGQYIEFNVIVDTIETDSSGDIEKAKSAWGVNPKTGVAE